MDVILIHVLMVFVKL
jgi:hypothetical protein